MCVCVCEVCGYVCVKFVSEVCGCVRFVSEVYYMCGVCECV